MTLPIHESPRASRDIVDSYKRIAVDQPRAAERFLEAVDEATEGLQLFPHSGRPYPTSSPRLMGIRMIHVPGFRNFMIFYRVGDSIAILRVLHGARDLERILDEPTDDVT